MLLLIWLWYMGIQHGLGGVASKLKTQLEAVTSVAQKSHKLSHTTLACSVAKQGKWDGFVSGWCR